MSPLTVSPPPFRRISYFLPQSQVVAGTNYRCKVKTAAGTVNVSVFESLDGVANLSGCSAGRVALVEEARPLVALADASVE